MTEEEKLVEAVINATVEVDGKKKLPCAKAFELARKLGANTREISNICNAQNIRICKCQLGCFE